MRPIPKSAFQFGQAVTVHWHEAECPPSEAVITGLYFDHRRSIGIEYTITEPNGSQTDNIDESMLKPR